MTVLVTPPSFIVIIRTAGERTFPVCKKLVLEQVPDTCLHIVNECPFEAALRHCYEIGIDSGVEWMVTLDADVLLGNTAITNLLKEAEVMSENHFQVEGMVLDKLTRRFRWAGYRVYRVKHLQTAKDLLPRDRSEIRPESSTIERMAARGYPYIRSKNVYGIHDHEQYLSDIYRKAFIHANKHPQWLPELLGAWKEMAKEDVDFRVALSGAFDGLLTSEEPRIDTRDFAELAELALTKLELAEKDALGFGDVDFSKIDKLINDALKSPDIKEVVINSTQSPSLAAYFVELGPLRIFPYLTGKVLCRLGKFIKRSSLAKTQNK